MKLKIDKLKLDNIRGIFSHRDGTHGKSGRKLPFSPVFLLALILSAALAWAAAFLLCAEIEIALTSRILDAQVRISGTVQQRTPSAFSTSAAQAKRELSFRPFHVNERSPKDSSSAKKSNTQIDSFILIGTIKPVAAWLEAEGKASLVLKGQEFNGYELIEINSDNAVFKMGEESYTIFLNFSNSAARPKKNRTEASTAKQQNNSNVQNAEFDGKDGTVSRELLHTLLMNPYDELGKLRLVPTAGGMIVESMRSDSLLNELGVKPGDEITGINGISIKDVPSIMNAINSMMSGARLDFDVTRANKTGKLGYVVK